MTISKRCYIRYLCQLTNIQQLAKYDIKNMKHLLDLNKFSLQLASVLQVETELVKQAVSLYCRLQFAKRLNSETDRTFVKHSSWNHQPLPNME